MMQKEFIFPGSINSLRKILEDYSADNIFLVRGNRSFIKSGAKRIITPFLKDFNITDFFGFDINPKIEDARGGFELLKKNKCKLIVAIGGGSVLDTAKIIKYLAIKENEINGINKSIPIIAIPTTAGTGSEATHFAVVYIAGKKYSYQDERILPDVSIVDANLLKSQSSYQMAVSGIDAFAQGIESFWSINSTQESIIYSEKAIKLVWENLEKAVFGDIIAQIKLAEGSNYAGKAISITKTTAPHALSYGFTSMFGLPHGHSVALFLPFFILFHKIIGKNQCNDIRGVKYVNNQLKKIASFLEVDYNELDLKVKLFFKKVGIEINFSFLNISRSDFQLAVKDLNIERINNNPGKITSELIRDIYKYNTW